MPWKGGKLGLATAHLLLSLSDEIREPSVQYFLMFEYMISLSVTFSWNNKLRNGIYINHKNVKYRKLKLCMWGSSVIPVTGRGGL
jgi:hypothetical protein